MPNRITEQLKDVWLITQKELLYLSRDPDVLIYAVLVPLVIYPVMFIGANDLVFWVLGQVEKQKARVAIEHVQDATRYELVVAAVKDTKEAQIVEPPDAMAALRAGKIDAYVTFEPPNTVAVNVLQSNLIDKTASKVMSAIYSEHYDREKEAIKKAGLTHHDLEVFDVSIVDIAPSASKGEIVPVRDLGGVPLPLLILFAFVWLHIAVGMGPPATVMFAEQREKRTIETTFLEPVGRNALVGAKVFTTWLIGMFAGAMYAIGIALTVGTLVAVVSVRTAEKMGYRQGNLLALLSALKMQGVAAESWMLLALTAVINTALVAMIYLACASRAPTFKQAQALITIPMMLAIVIPIAAFIPGLELNTMTAFCPMLNLFLVLKRGEPDVTLTLLALGFNLAVFAACFLITKYMVSIENSKA